MATVVNKNAQNDIVTRAVNGYVQADLIADKILPTVPVNNSSVDIYEFGSEHMKRYETARPLKSDIQTADTDDWTKTTVDLVEHAFGFDLDEKEIRNGGKMMNVLREYGRRAMKSLMLDKEIRAAELVFSDSTYTNKVTLSGTNQWSDVDDSNPIGNINTAISTVRGSVGADPNTIVLGDAVFKALKNNDQIKEMIKYVGKVLTPDILAGLLGIENVIIGKSVYSNDGTLTDVWGKHALVAYIPKSPAIEVPALGYTYELQNSTKGYLYDANNSGKVKTVAASSEYLQKVVWETGGYFIKNASA
jgi:hypothetical protein